MVKVLVADDDLDVHELVHDLLELNFRDVKIDRALNSESFANKLNDAKPQYDLILFNIMLDQVNGEDLLTQSLAEHPEIIDRVVLLAGADTVTQNPQIKKMPVIPKPFSLDHFGEVVKKACQC